MRKDTSLKAPLVREADSRVCSLTPLPLWCIWRNPEQTQSWLNVMFLLHVIHKSPQVLWLPATEGSTSWAVAFSSSDFRDSQGVRPKGTIVIIESDLHFAGPRISLRDSRTLPSDWCLTRLCLLEGDPLKNKWVVPAPGVCIARAPRE